MELTQSQHSTVFEDQLLTAPKIDNSSWIPFPDDQFFPDPWTLTLLNQTPNLNFPTTNPSLPQLISPPEFTYTSSCCPFDDIDHELQLPFLDGLNSELFTSSYNYHKDDDIDAVVLPTSIPTTQEDGFDATILENTEIGFFDNCVNKVEQGVISTQYGAPNMDINKMGFCEEKKIEIEIKKKAHCFPSKNLMAERRRRKRLNDRLSMLRSIVPKISKMDRTSILGDTIDYMKELIGKIHNLREEAMDKNMINKVNLIGNCFKDIVKTDEILVRNPPKFDVERRDKDSRIEVYCNAKPGLLLSTINTLDVLGLEIQQCVISCFSDFSLQASCYEVTDHRSLVGSEDVRQALFRNAGYGGKCL